MHLFIRADADTKIGAGHIMRCIALGQAWQDQGGKVSIISRCDSDALKKRIQSEGFMLVTLDHVYPDPSDLINTLTIIKNKIKEEKSWLVLDGYHYDSEYQQAICDTGVPLLVIDDINHLSHYHTDILLNQNIHAPELDYHCDEDTTILLGTSYVLLRREFLNHPDSKRHTAERANNILVTLGGADPDNVTLKVIEALKILDDPEIQLKIIVGPANPHQNMLLQSLSSIRSNSELLINPCNMPELMAWADLAVSAGGSTCWELMFMGVPSLLFILSENQEPIAAGLYKSMAAQNLGWHNRYNFSELPDLIFSLMSDFSARKTMSDNSKDLVDGMGSFRMCDYMMEGRA